MRRYRDVHINTDYKLSDYFDIPEEEYDVTDEEPVEIIEDIDENEVVEITEE